jgi:hypothetical protein
VPKIGQDNFDEKQVNGLDKWQEENKELLEQNEELLRRNSIQNLFAGYDFDLDNVRREIAVENRKEKAVIKNSSLGE